MLKITKYKKNSSNNENFFWQTGTFESEVTNIGFPDDYVEGEALEVTYSITTEKGAKPYKELFHCKNYNSRTNDFFEYLESCNISLDDVSEFIGCKEKLTFKKVVSGNRTLISIVDREFISKSTEAPNGI